MSKDDITSTETSTFTGTKEPHVFGTIQKADDQLIMISLNDYKGYKYIDCRQWWKPESKEDFLPTKSGFTVPINNTLYYLEQLIEALEKAKEWLEDNDKKPANA